MTQKYTITSEEGLEATQYGLRCIECVLASLRHDLLPDNPRLYALMSEGYIDDIWEMLDPLFTPPTTKPSEFPSSLSKAGDRGMVTPN